MTKRNGPSLLGIFKQYFADNPEWLRTRDSEPVLAQFAKDHPKIKVDQRVKQSMFNAKNHMRKGTKAKHGRKRKVAEITAAMKTPHVGNSALQLLENSVDECLAMARTIGKESLREVVGHLHRARNLLVMKIEA
jgi:hypothetical protein